MSRILVAGRDALLEFQFRKLMEDHGYDFILCSRLSDAVSVILEDPPDLLIVEKGFGGNGDVELIKASKACLQKANMPILLVMPSGLLRDLNWALYPVDDLIFQPLEFDIVLTRIRLAESRMRRVFDNNPLTKLPGNTSIIKAIQRALDSTSGQAVCYVDIDNFKPYNDRYGFARGDEVLLMTARILVNVIEEAARDGSFVGHVGGDDFVFIVREEKVCVICEKVIANFELVRNMFLDRTDIKAGGFIGKDRQGRESRFGLLSISIGVVTTFPGKYRHYGEVAEVASQIKSFVKKIDGSNYMINRRE